MMIIIIIIIWGLLSFGDFIDDCRLNASQACLR